MIFYLIVIAVLTFSFLVIKIKNSKYSNIPPGPPASLILGTIPYFRRRKLGGIGGVLKHVANGFGDLVSIWNGPNLLVIINDFKLCKDLFSRDDCSGRPTTWWHQNVRGQNGRCLGIINTSGSVWQEQRRFALKQLKDFGFGKKDLDSVIQEEASKVIQSIIEESSQNDGHCRFASTFNTPIINVLWQIVASTRFDPKDPQTIQLMEMLNQLFSESFNPISFFPLIRSLLPDSLIPKRDRQLQYLKGIFRELVQEHESSFDPTVLRDFIDVYLNEIKSDRGKSFDMEQLVVICLDFFQAGAETTSTSLLWSVMYMALNPDVQSKCQEEIDEVIGNNTFPSMNDMKRLPYVAATIMEIQRMSCTAPGSVPHETTSEINVQGYRLPAGTQLISNLFKIMRDPEIFPEPDRFDPERYLIRSDDGILKTKKTDQVVPFGIGKRICMGESLARSELFIFFVQLMQNLKFSAPSVSKYPSLNQEDMTAGITLIPRPFYLKVEQRNSESQ